MAYYFGGGSPRTGCTLLVGILCSDPTTNPSMRSNVALREIVDCYKRLKASHHLEDGHYFPQVSDIRDLMSKWVTEYLELIRERYAPARHLAFKSYPLTLTFPELFELVPDAKFLISVRDPRDTIASMIVAGENLVKQGRENRWPRDAARLAEEYNMHYEPCLSSENDEFKRQILYVNYEKLVTDPVSQVDRIRSWAELELSEFDPAMAWQRTLYDYVNVPEKDVPYLTELYGKAISSSRVGRFREILTDVEIRVINHECASIMKVMHYVP